MKTTINATKISGAILSGLGLVLCIAAAPVTAQADERHDGDHGRIEVRIAKDIHVDLRFGDRDDIRRDRDDRSWRDRDEYRKDKDDYRRDRDDHGWRDRDDHHDHDDHRR